MSNQRRRIQSSTKHLPFTTIFSIEPGVKHIQSTIIVGSMRCVAFLLTIAAVAAQVPTEASLRRHQDSKTQIEEEMGGFMKEERRLQDDCGGCDYHTGGKCVLQERLIVACGECLFLNECFAVACGMDASTCTIVGTDP